MYLLRIKSSRLVFSTCVEGFPDVLGERDKTRVLASEPLMPRYMKLLSGMKKSQINKLRKEARIDVENRLKKK